MAKFCAKCGSRLDEETGICPKCDAEKIKKQAKQNVEQTKAATKNAEIVQQQKLTLGKKEEKKKSKTEKKTAKKERKVQKKADKKAKKKEKWAKLTLGQKIRKLFMKLVLLVLLLLVVISGILGALSYWNVIEVPFIDEWLPLLEIETDSESEETDFSILDGSFTQIKVTDEKSAIKAVQEGAEQLGLSNAAEELTLSNMNSVDDLTYYRLRQNYQGYPVYGKDFVLVVNSDGDVSGMTANCFDITLEQMKPMVTQEKVNAAIIEYLMDLTSVTSFEYVDIEPITEENLCIYTLENRDAKLVYELHASTEYGNYTIFVDSNNAEIVFCLNNTLSMQQEFTYAGQQESRTFVAEKGDQQNVMYYVGKDGTKIKVYIPDSENQYDWYYDNNSTEVSWSGNDNPDTSAVDAMYNVSKVYNYYLETFNQSSFNGEGEDINVYVHTIGYRDWKGKDKSSVNNAYFWMSPNGPILSFTKNYDDTTKDEIDEYTCELDVVGHEFTHGIVKYTAGLRDTESNLMPGAINEAVADIMGYCAEAAITGRKIDWTCSVRTSIKNNNTKEDYIYHTKDYKGAYKECHSASTIVSYAAYLMNSSNAGSLNDNEVARLWYHTILTLPSNCTFKVLRQHVEMVAKNLSFSDQQKECIAKAFDTVGITLADSIKKDNEYNPNITLKVFDYNSKAYDDYTVSIEGKYNTGWFGWSWFGLFEKTYNEQFSVNTVEEQHISLNANGEYTITISDDGDSEETYEKKIKVKEKYENSVMSFATAYGNPSTENSENIFDKLAIPEGAVEFNGHYYHIFDMDNIKTWSDAKTFCESQGGYLATITSQEENDFLYNYIKSEGYSSAYFGLTDSEREGAWVWSNGEEVSYINWHYGEPNAENSEEDYALFYYKYDDGTWNDGDFGNRTVNSGTAFICEWGEYEIASDSSEKAGRVTSDERDIVLVLDVSGSMSGTPMEETKKASVNFIDTILDEDASIGIVTYDSSASMRSDFSTNKTALETTVSGIYDGGSTNIEAGLSEAYSMLSTSNARKKIIVLMSDGEPNDGKEGDDLIAYADSLKDDGIIIYTLGFFESMGSEKSSAQILMEEIASDGYHYEVASADDLVFFFEDMADQINGQKYIYIRIACPVDVSVTYNGETLCSGEDELSLRTDFGTLTFEENEEETDNDDRIKVLRLKEGVDYDVEIVGTGRGIMDYTIGFMDENGDYSDFRRFENIKITRQTKIDTVATISDESILKIDEDGDGKYDLKLRAAENGYGEEVKDFVLIYIIAGCSAVSLLLIIVLVGKKKHKNKRMKEKN